MSAAGRWRAPMTAAALALTLFLGSSAVSPAKAPKKKPRSKPTPAADFDVRLPVLGTRLAEYPAGNGKAVADVACLQCHSASMAAQQRLNEKQWAKEIDKMAGWGAVVPAGKKEELLAYLLANFGPDNDGFEPTVTRPVGK